MKKYFLNLSDDELIKKIKHCDDKINQYQKPINEYDKHLEIFKKTKNDNIEAYRDNPIVLGGLLNLKEDSDGTGNYVMLKDAYFETINENSDENRRYILNKAGNRFFYTEMMDHWVKNEGESKNLPQNGKASLYFPSS